MLTMNMLTMLDFFDRNWVSLFAHKVGHWMGSRKENENREKRGGWRQKHWIASLGQPDVCTLGSAWASLVG
jgi:hypothetical protein